MKKLTKMKYTDSKGNRKVYSYYLTISKDEIKKAGLDPNSPVNIIVKGKEIIISQ